MTQIFVEATTPSPVIPEGMGAPEIIDVQLSQAVQQEDISDWPLERVADTLDGFYQRLSNCRARESDSVGDVPPQLTRLVQIEGRLGGRIAMHPDRLDLLDLCISQADTSIIGSGELGEQLADLLSAAVHAYDRKAQNSFYTAAQRTQFRQKSVGYQGRLAYLQETKALEARVSSAIGAVAIKD